MDRVDPFDIGLFGLDSPAGVNIVGLPYLIAQKLHACTEIFDGGANERVHDLMDLLLARDLLAPDELPRVREACAAIFGSRGKQSWPPILNVYPGWSETFARIADDEGFPLRDVDDAAVSVREFISEIDSAE